MWSKASLSSCSLALLISSQLASLPLVWLPKVHHPLHLGGYCIFVYFFPDHQELCDLHIRQVEPGRGKENRYKQSVKRANHTPLEGIF